MSSFHPSAVTSSDVSAALRVITIGTVLPMDAQLASAHANIEQWNDVRPANSATARRAILSRKHIKKQQLAKR